MKQRNHCETELLASTDHCELSCCGGCGQIVLTLPHITLRLPVALFAEIAECVELAAPRLSEMGSEEEETAAPKPRRRAGNSCH